MYRVHVSDCSVGCIKWMLSMVMWMPSRWPHHSAWWSVLSVVTQMRHIDRQDSRVDCWLSPWTYIYIHRSMLSRHSFNIINQLPGDADTYLAYVTEHCVHVVFVLVQITGQVCIGVSSLGACKQVQPKWPQVWIKCFIHLIWISLSFTTFLI